MLPRGIDLSARQMENVDKCLERLHWETEAQYVLLADITGQLISERGTTGKMNTAVLSALAAGELAATKEMASLVGEQARFRMVLHEGWQSSVYLSDVGEEMLLITVFSNNIPIGMVRVFTKEIVTELMDVVAQPESDVDKRADDLSDFDTLLADELNTSFSESWNADVEEE